MSIGMRILAGLLALITAAGVASAQNDPCPECDSDGPAGDSGSYSSIDLGAITDNATALVDTDASFSDSDDEEGFWAWLSICLSVFVERIENLLGVESPEVDLDANVDAFISDDGVDLDANVQLDDEVCDNMDGNVTEALGGNSDCVFSFDRSELGDLDGETWKVAAEAKAALGLDEVNLPVGGEHIPEDIDIDLCLYAELELGVCG